jgi:uncharacterized protein YbjT (DUF2867 family)
VSAARSSSSSSSAAPTCASWSAIPPRPTFPAGVEVAKGDLLDIDALRAAFTGVRTLFLLNAVAGDEFTQALITLNIARECGRRADRLSVGDPHRPLRERAALRGEVMAPSG